MTHLFIPGVSTRMVYHTSLGPAVDRADRLRIMTEMRQDGYSLSEIGRAFELTRERVRQLLAPIAFDREAVEAKRLARAQANRPVRVKKPRDRKAWQRRRMRQHKAKRRALVQELKQLATKLGKRPSYSDITQHLGYWQTHARYFTGRSHRQSPTCYRRGAHRWMRLAGLTPP